jgi:hypothetical protein
MRPIGRRDRYSARMATARYFKLHPPLARRPSEPEAQRRPTAKASREAGQRAGEDEERQRYRTRLDAGADGATKKLKAAARGGTRGNEQEN